MLRCLFGILLGIVLVLTTTNCRKDSISDNPNNKLDFSVDTVLFDTVFTTVGSTTKNFKVYNNNNQGLNISSIELAGGLSSPFRINVDGVPGVKHEDIEILGKDSMYIFVEVTLDVNNGTLPLIVEDSIIFFTNGNRQVIDLVVWGQDAYFHANEIAQGTWPTDKPHVIYGTAAVGFPGLDSNLTLNIQAGTQVHVHANSRLFVYKSTLNINGVEGNEVVFQGDRLEPYYQDIPGQWEAITVQNGINCLIEHAIVKNGTYGIISFLDNPNGGNPALTVRNTISKDNSYSGLWGDQSYLVAENCEVVNNGQFCCVLLRGGRYEFDHCTIASYWNFGGRTNPAFMLRNYFQENPSSILVYDYNQSSFNNCIFDGNTDEEYLIDTITGANMDFSFTNCMMKTTESILNDPSFYTQVHRNKSTFFVDPYEGDFSFYSTAFQLNKGSVTLSSDIDNLPRPVGSSSDIGARERQ